MSQVAKYLLLFLIVVSLIYAQTVVTHKGVLRGVEFAPLEVGAGPPPPPPTDSAGAEWNIGEIIGGGFGYSDTISAEMVSNNHTSSWVVGTGGTPTDSLIAFAAAAGSGDTIVVNDANQLEWSAVASLSLTGGVILSGQRGTINDDTTSWGAMLYVDSAWGYNDQYTKRIITMAAKSRVTGFQLRGSYSPLEGATRTADTCNRGMTNEYAIYVYDVDSCEIDNNDMWGFGNSPVDIKDNSRGTNVHHNYFHHQGLTYYYGYGTKWYCMATPDSCDVIFNGNFWDWGATCGGGGGNYGQWVSGEIMYNIFGRSKNSAMYMHGANQDDYIPTAQIYRNTFWKTTYAEGNSNARVYRSGDSAEDTIRIYLNWCYPQDSAHSFIAYASPTQIYDNEFTPVQPEGLSARIPTAVIGTDIDSGTIPLEFTAWAHGSSDPDGSIMQYYWIFGDSNSTSNTVRYDSMRAGDTVSYTFDDIGKYYVELMVVDDDGCRDMDFHTVLAKPASDDSMYLSFWANDFTNNANAADVGYTFAQVLLEYDGHSWVVWERDLAGWQNWAHVVVSIYDSIIDWGCDSVDLVVRAYAKQNLASPADPSFYFDDIWMFGGTVLDWNIETGQFAFDTLWSGTNKRGNGIWIPNEVGPGYCWENEHAIHTGFNALSVQFWWGSVTAGNYAEYRQTVDIPSQ